MSGAFFVVIAAKFIFVAISMAPRGKFE